MASGEEREVSEPSGVVHEGLSVCGVHGGVGACRFFLSTPALVNIQEAAPSLTFLCLKGWWFPGGCDS